MKHIEKLRNKDELIKAVAYCRYSSEMQREESIDAQIRAINNYAASNGMKINEVYIDRAKSATTVSDRPEFQRMIDDSSDGKFNAIIVHKLDRFARNRYDSATYRHILKKNDVQLFSVIENFNDSPESIILESVIEGYNEYYSRNLAREVEKGKRENALKCKHTGGTPCLGYEVDRNSMKLVINELEAEAVRLIFSMYIDGKGYGEIISQLNTNGFKTKRGAVFGKNSLYEILKNEKYTGVYIYNKSVSKSIEGKHNRHKYKDDDDIIRVEGGVPQIITKETFDLAQVKMKMTQRKAAKHNAKETYFLSGKIICGECGATYTGNCRKERPDHPKYVSYRCSKMNGKNKCSNKEIRREDIEDLVLKKLANNIFSDDMIPIIAERINNYTFLRDKQSSLIKNNITERMKVVDKEIDYIDGEVKFNPLFYFDYRGTDDKGNCLGHHIRVGDLSDKLASRMLENGANFETVKRYASEKWKKEKSEAMKL